MMALALSYAGLASLCFAMPAHWRHLRAGKAPRVLAGGLRVLGSALLLAALVLCAARRGWPIGSVAWFGMVSAAGLALIGLLALNARLALGIAFGGPILAALLAL